MIKDILGTMITIILVLLVVAEIINAFCYFSFYRKYNKIFKNYKYIVGYKDKEDIVINSKFDGDIYIAYKRFGEPDLIRVYNSDIMCAVYDFKRLLKDEVSIENEAAYELHFSSFDDDDTAKNHIVYIISNVYYTPKDTNKILKSLKEMTK